MNTLSSHLEQLKSDFDRDGYVVARAMFSPAEVAELIAAFEGIHAAGDAERLHTDNIKDATDPQWAGDADFKEWLAWMKKYQPDANPDDSGNVYAYAVSATMRHVLTQCGDNLTRANLMKQAASMHQLEVPMLLPGIKINTSATDFYPIQSVRLAKFDGEKWALFGDVLSNEST